MDSVIIAVLVVLGIIVAGGFLLYFLGDLLMGISGKKKDVDAIREKQLKQQKELEERVNALENAEEARKDPEIATVLYGSGNGQVEAYDPNEEEEEETVEETPVEEEVEEETTEETEEDLWLSPQPVSPDPYSDSVQAAPGTQSNLLLSTL